MKCSVFKQKREQAEQKKTNLETQSKQNKNKKQ